MEYIKLNGLDLPASRLCMGGCPAGEYGWGNVSRAEVEAAMLSAVEAGINFFDTADTYGLGRSEETLGEVLRPHRQKVLLATKFGVRVKNGKTFYDNSPSYLHEALQNSLHHLHTDYIDLYQVHYLDERTPVDQLMEALLSYKREGVIRAIGLSNLTSDQAKAFRPYKDDISTFQQHYSLAHRYDEATIRNIACQLDASPLTWGSLGQGILTGKYDSAVHFAADDRRSRPIYKNFYGDKLKKNLQIVEAMRPIASKYEVPISSVAIRWILDTLPKSIVITGVKTPQQTLDNALTFSFSLTAAERKVLQNTSS